MLRHNFLLAFRSFMRHKSTFFINLIGLSTGLTCTLFIYLWVTDELNIDKFHENNNRLYQALINRQNTNDISTERATPALLAESLAAELPEVEYAVATTLGMTIPPFSLTVKDKHIKASGRLAGKDFLNMFSYNIIQGNRDQALIEKNSIIITEKLSKRLFNTTENILGKVVDWQLGGNAQQAIITGVMQDIPAHSTDQFDFLLSFEIFKDWMGPGANQWGTTAPSTFLLLRKGVNPDSFQAKVAGFIKSKEATANTELFIRPYADKYLYNNFENGMPAGGRITYVRLFSVIALFILIIACINFMNLFTAQASRRTKEIGVKKAVGANRKTLIIQYLTESLSVAFMALVVAILLTPLLLPQFNEITGKQLVLSFDNTFIAAITIITLVTGLTAGSYPAFSLSRFKPTEALKGKTNAGKLKTSTGEVWTRKGLVIFQFAVSVILIMSVIIVYQQIEYIQSKNLGYNKDQVIYFNAEGSMRESLETFLSELENIPGVVSASSTTHKFAGHQSKTYLNWPGKNPEDIVSFEIVQVNYGFMEMLEIEPKAGRSFSQKFSTDSAKIIFNQAAVKAMGLPDPVGEIVTLWGQDREIIGVVGDFHFQSLHEPVTPLLFLLTPAQTNKIMVKIEAKKERETIGRLQQFYQKYNPGFTLDYQFLDDTYQTLYVAEQRVSALSKYFAGLAVIISCLGLFGLSTFLAERRLKEIGIRKVMGASEVSIVYLLSGDFTKMVLTAIIIALPVSYFAARQWLKDFAFNIELTWWYFAGAGMVGLLIAWLSVGLQTMQAARANPVKCLKDE